MKKVIRYSEGFVIALIIGIYFFEGDISKDWKYVLLLPPFFGG
ncbi:hypothetical protein OFO10_07320 [Campylobacter sp. VBCF_06 NA8]|nr:hypothetical protein [Campylobacter sp. VBCF_06 NA8]MDA3046966.1 hypothetical protein [Campylobacter sp. VBCF_06 NA8]